MSHTSNAATRAPSSQMVTTAVEKLGKKQFDVYEIEKLKKEAERMELTPEIRDLVEAHKKLQTKLQEKATKLGILEAIAMESMDENIVELRNQLFTVVTLLYSDKIDEIIKEQATQEVNPPGLDGDMGMVFDDRGDVKEDCPKYDIINRMREYLTKRTRYKKQLATLKRDLKYKTGL